ncbi:unnamed protein product [Vitrella brassicaformis CCMP3155]|uniref:Dynein light chain n=2 Tax=Vitrella brassicaformis TaxID=1169539 RepID=A0A0G4FZU7_VITBC|nr:unnamed protein product [Vitrella brassicaformis CCMP3155]|eukprot:CEM21162.1 unnamed protein product [Vitrella brassicaformis CCMP3155]
MAVRPIPNELKKQMQRAVIKHTDMNSELQTEVVDVVIGGIDKHAGASGVNLENASRLIKDTLDKQYGAQWHCVLGEGFSFDITAQDGSLMYCFYQGNLAILVFKC